MSQSTILPELKVLITDFNSRIKDANNTYESNQKDYSNKSIELSYRLYETGLIKKKIITDRYDIPVRENSELSNSLRLGFIFPVENSLNYLTYVILSEDQCIQFREEMKQIIQFADSIGYLQPIDKNSLIRAFNAKVVKVHNLYCDENGSSLLEKKQKGKLLEIYRFWNDGEITTQEGTRSEYTHYGYGSIPGARMYTDFEFVLVRKINNHILTYIIGTREECEDLRKEMYRLVLFLTNTK